MSHALTLRVDAFGVVTRAASVAYPRRDVAVGLPEQGQTAVLVTQSEVVHQAFGSDRHRLGTPVSTETFELVGLVGDDRAPLSREQINAGFQSAAAVEFEAVAAAGQRRRLSRSSLRYYNDALAGPLPLGQVGLRALAFEGRALAMTDAQRVAVFGDDVDAAVMAEGGYVLENGGWWARSGRHTFDAQRFYVPVSAADPFGNATTVEYDAHALAVTAVTDPAGNRVDSQLDCRTMQPAWVTDPNRNRTAAAFDALGMLEASAVMGKETEGAGDTLQDPTTRVEYDLWAYHRTREDAAPEPAFVRTFAREQHGADNPRWVEAVAYFDGGGAVIQTKVQAEPGLAPERDVDGALVLDAQGGMVRGYAPSRWVGNGRTIVDNKGNPIKRYEPFFSDRADFESEAVMVEQGGTPLLHYDPLGRLTRTREPDGTLSRVEFSPWWQRSFDANDTVFESRWHAERAGLPIGTPGGRARMLAEAHAGTHTTRHLDSQGRVVVVDALLDADTVVRTRQVMDIEGNVAEVRSAMNVSAELRTFAMGGVVLRTTSLEAGERRGLGDVGGAPLRSFNARGFAFRGRLDVLRRSTHQFVRQPGGEELLVGRTVYGEDAPDGLAANLLGRAWRSYDPAGLAQSEGYDFKGNAVASARWLARAYTQTPDWSGLVDAVSEAQLDAASTGLLETQMYATSTTYDALDRPTTQTSPDGSVVRHGYNEAGLLERVSANVRGAAEETTLVASIAYDAKGQRERIEYGNDTETTYAHDPETFRLMRLQTTRGSDGARLQDLQYTYDPVGNITEVGDGAQQTVYFNNAAVTAEQRFECDALYRLTEASGREHDTASATQLEYQDPLHSTVSPGDGQALTRYAESYEYDAVGNIVRLQHVANNGGAWTRRYRYERASAGNRLQATSIATDAAGQYSAVYGHDAHGNMTSMPHLDEVAWEFADRMASATTTGAGAGPASAGGRGRTLCTMEVGSGFGRCSGCRGGERRSGSTWVGLRCTGSTRGFMPATQRWMWEWSRWSARRCM